MTAHRYADYEDKLESSIGKENHNKKNLFLQIFCSLAFIEQKVNDSNDNLCKIRVGLYIASVLMTNNKNDIIV